MDTSEKPMRLGPIRAVPIVGGNRCAAPPESATPKLSRLTGRQVATGFFAYHAVPTNSAALSAFRHHVTNLWRRSLQRRSQKDGCTWPLSGVK